MDIANRQNTDKGTISSGDASFPVLHVFRRTAGEEGRLTAVHFIAAAASPSAESACPLAAGDAVRVSLDWGRRLDNMQQHSGQHLISALFENRHGSQPRARATVLVLGTGVANTPTERAPRWDNFIPPTPPYQVTTSAWPCLQNSRNLWARLKPILRTTLGQMISTFLRLKAADVVR